MSKPKIVAMETPAGVSVGGYVVYEYDVKNLEGKLLTLIESLGLKDTQEKSVKSLFKDILYRSLYLDTIFVQGNILNEALKKNYEASKTSH